MTYRYRNIVFLVVFNKTMDIFWKNKDVYFMFFGKMIFYTFCAFE